MSRREHKQKLVESLLLPSEQDMFEALRPISGRGTINVLIPLFCHHRDMIRWRAIVAMGFLVSILAEENLEAARIIVRRLIWNLNDESGGIGWGSPEAMAEIMSGNTLLCQEFAHMLVAFTRKDGSYLEYEPLQRGVLWGLGRLARKNKLILIDLGVPPLLTPYLFSPDAHVRGLAALTTGLLQDQTACDILTSLQADHNLITLYDQGKLSQITVASLAQEALHRIQTT